MFSTLIFLSVNICLLKLTGSAAVLKSFRCLTETSEVFPIGCFYVMLHGSDEGGQVAGDLPFRKMLLFYSCFKHLNPDKGKCFKLSWCSKARLQWLASPHWHSPVQWCIYWLCYHVTIGGVNVLKWDNIIIKNFLFLCHSFTVQVYPCASVYQEMCK